MNTIKSYKYKNLTFFVMSIFFALFISQFEIFHEFLLHLNVLGLVGAFIGGILFVSTFTVATGTVILLVLAESYSPLQIGIVAGLGAVVGDVMIFRFVKDNLTREVEAIYQRFDHNHHVRRVLHTKYFSWTLPVVGAIIIASPFPDEIGVSLMGISKMRTYKFLFISLILNTIGIFLVITASTVIKP